ncbi:ALG6, ALG8 glycosyltransferase family protein [Cardiosporidium cionae]|uniref:Alpha-1,3-glucosyltransferase n=1 Tax=Cardiosporidium cionae TaxID=476202 RepID=A0ABQ7JBP3_9APIC|nr:ALG6, ALG8 glycosyltransferase family protein [Cardiosporidium cionae]|eukprot:KAF8821420.1 ALG6, ALG8 glycosyltransferase family protein [Cardiosporidium cionae]
MQIRQRISAGVGGHPVDTSTAKSNEVRRSIFVARCNQEISRIQERANIKGVYISLPDVLNFPLEESDYPPQDGSESFKAYRVYISFTDAFFKDLYSTHCASLAAFTPRDPSKTALPVFPDWLYHLDIAEFWLELYESYPFESPLLHCRSFPAILGQGATDSITLLSPEQTTRRILKEEWSPSITLTCILNRIADYVTEQTHLLFNDFQVPSKVMPSRLQQRNALFTPSDSLQKSESSVPDKGFYEGSHIFKIFKALDDSFSHRSILLVLVLLFLIFLRVTVGLGSYSGEGERETGFGDYEAQRHWMELTLHTPLQKWYGSTPEFPSSWWPLDYPPLSAYHAYIFGKLSSLYEPSSMIPVSSRGYETASHKYFMRWTVILSDLLFMFSGAAYYWFFIYPKVESIQWMSQTRFFLLLLSCPVFVLVDHGHFQYNCVALGLFLWAICFMAKRQPLAASVAFMLSLLFKQTMLYYAPSFFFILLGVSLRKVSSTDFFMNKCTVCLILLFFNSFEYIWYTMESTESSLSYYYPSFIPTGNNSDRHNFTGLPSFPTEWFR